MNILITGAAGFIGYHLTKNLCKQNKINNVIGIDNLNAYYDIKLKIARLGELGFSKKNISLNKYYKSKKFKNLRFIKSNIDNYKSLDKIFKKNKFDIVINLAAQAGVRYSLVKPKKYINSNIVGFFNVINCSKDNGIKKILYASSSSVYGSNLNIPFKEIHKTDNPVSLYAASKKSNEIIANSYNHLYDMNIIGLRFFTVYGPFGRPDMAYYIFTKSISENKKIKVYNYGNMYRDFTYIDDIVKGITLIVLDKTNKYQNNNIYNIGNNKPVKLLDFINIIEKNLKTKANLEMLPLQDGDVKRTWASIDRLIMDYNYKPKTSIENGIKKFVAWFNKYHNK